MKKILVTGGTGYIGSHTIIELLQNNYDVDIVDNLVNSKIEVVDKIEKIAGRRPGFYKCDLLDYEKLSGIFAENQYDLVMHFAGLKAVAESVEKPLLYYETNVGGTINLLKCMKKYDVKRIIFSSSATVYGEQKVNKLDESLATGVGIASPYGKTKYMIEEILKDVAAAEPDFGVTILRYFNPIGNHPSGLIGEDPNGLPNNLMPIIMRVAAGKIDKLKIYGDDYPTRDGTCIRDYIHVMDLARGHVMAADNLKCGVNIYNLGTGAGASVMEMVRAFENAGGEKLPYEIAPRRAGDLAEYFAEPEKAKRELGWQAEQTVEDAMRDTISFLEASGQIG